MAVDDRLQWGAVVLTSQGAPVGLPYVIDASADGTNWGNPAAVIREIQSRLQDGSLAAVDSYGNREAPIKLCASADTYDGLGAAEDVLVAETRRPGYNTLTWTPSQALAVPTVFDVVYAVLTWDFDDFAETQLKRYFTATLACLPYARSATEVVQAALAAPGSTTITSINTCGSTTGWTKPAASSIASTAGKIVVTGDAAEPQWAQLAALVIMGADRFVFVDWQWVADDDSRVDSIALEAAFDGTPVSAAASIVSPTAGYTRTFFLAPASWSTVRFTALRGGAAPAFGNATLRLDQVSRVDAIGDEGTGRQLFRSIPVQGSVRTQGRLAIEHETDALGTVLAYVYCDDGSGYTPPLRRWLVSSGATTDDPTLVSGHRNMLDTLWVAEVPAGAVPEGNSRLYALLRGSGAGTVDLNIVATTIVGGNDVGNVSETATVDVTTDWAIVDLTGLELPPAKLARRVRGKSLANAVVQISIQDADLSGIDVDIDEAWIFNLDVGALTQVDCDGKYAGTPPAAGGASNRLWLDPATITNDGQDAVYVGFTPNRFDAFNPAGGILGWTPPVFEPPAMNGFFVSTNAPFPAITLAYYPRSLHNARAVS